MTERIPLADYRDTVALRVLAQREGISRLQRFIDKINFNRDRQPLATSFKQWAAFTAAYQQDKTTKLWVLKSNIDSSSPELRNFYKAVDEHKLTNQQYAVAIAGGRGQAR